MSDSAATVTKVRALIEAHFAPMGPSKADTIKALCELLDVVPEPALPEPVLPSLICIWGIV